MDEMQWAADFELQFLGLVSRDCQRSQSIAISSTDL